MANSRPLRKRWSVMLTKIEGFDPGSE